jgi:hypothetical protein
MGYGLMFFLKTTWKILARKRSKGKAILIKMHSILQNGKLVRPPKKGATKLPLIEPQAFHFAAVGSCCWLLVKG